MCADEIHLDDSTPAPARRYATVYYRQKGVTITSHHFRIDGVRYDVRELSNLMRAKGARHPAVSMGAAIVMVEAVFTIVVVGLTRSPMACWSVVVLLISGAAVLSCARRWPPRIELLACYRGQRVTLFVTRDEREFGQVARALGRATEAAALRRETARAVAAAAACRERRQ